MKFSITYLFLFFIFTVNAQVTNDGKPVSWRLATIEAIDPIIMPEFDIDALLEEDRANADKVDMPWRFGYEFKVEHNLDTSGKWTTLPNGDRIWRIRYQSSGAKTMNFLLKDFYIPKGATLYLYNNDRTDVLGAYDYSQNNEQEVLGTWVVKGEDIWLEYYEPVGVLGQGRFNVLKVIHGYRTMETYMSRNDFDNCFHDVDCDMPDIQGFKDINKKAVGMVLVNNSAWCSGALVTNTSNDGTPYFLTAEHCYSDPSEWAFRFNWISPDPVCAGTEDSTSNGPDGYYTLSGAALKAKHFLTDFCLVEINQLIPPSWGLVWAGWDRSDVPPPSTFSIHHPLGFIMKANLDFDPPIPSIGINWTVQNWDLGANAQGSSGSPLFDNNGRVIGQLHGGSSGCNGMTDNELHDIYGRFGISWEGDNTPETRLKDWLDPTGTNAVTTDYYIQPILAADAGLQTEMLLEGLCNNFANVWVTLLNTGTDNLTSVQLSYSVNSGPAEMYNWAGNLAPDESTTIQLPQLEGVWGSNEVTVNVVMANGVADGNISNNTIDEQFQIRQYQTGTVTLNLQTDIFGWITQWELQDQSGMLLYAGQNLEGNTSYTVPFPLGEGCYTFLITDDANGICCEAGEGHYSLTTANGEIIKQGGTFDSIEFVSFTLTDNLSLADNLLTGLQLYPNPSSGIFTLEGTCGRQFQYELYNVLGQQIIEGVITQHKNMLDISFAANGIYLLKVNEPETGKFINFKLVKE